jgi:hypothetical protein
MAKPTFEQLYMKALADRKKACKCKGDTQSILCPIHAKQAQAAIDLERKLNAKDVEETLDYDFLGIHMLPKRHGYLVRFATYLDGKRQQRFALLWQCGENMQSTRHKFTIFSYSQEIAESKVPLAHLFHTEPLSVSMTKPFVFHAIKTATDEARRMIETQCPTPTRPTGEQI